MKMGTGEQNVCDQFHLLNYFTIDHCLSTCNHNPFYTFNLIVFNLKTNANNNSSIIRIIELMNNIVDWNISTEYDAKNRLGSKALQL